MTSQNRSIEFALLSDVASGGGPFPGSGANRLFVCCLNVAHSMPPLIPHLQQQHLSAFAVGLPAFVLIKVLQPAFFAREDTKTPMYFAGINLVVNVVLSLGAVLSVPLMGLDAAMSELPLQRRLRAGATRFCFGAK